MIDTFELAIRFYEMFSDLSENLQILREVRGSFQDKSKNQTVEWCLIFIFLLIVPVALATLFLITRPLAMNSDHWILAVMIVVSLFTGFSVFVEHGLVEYEFTGDEIIEKLRGRIKMRIHINEITDVKVFYLGRHISILKTSRSEMKILRIPSLVAAIFDQANKMNARMSEGDREQAKKTTLQQVSSLKRTTVVAMIFYTVVVAALAVCIHWLVDKLQLK